MHPLLTLTDVSTTQFVFMYVPSLSHAGTKRWVRAASFVVSSRTGLCTGPCRRHMPIWSSAQMLRSARATASANVSALASTACSEVNRKRDGMLNHCTGTHALPSMRHMYGMVPCPCGSTEVVSSYTPSPVTAPRVTTCSPKSMSKCLCTLQTPTCSARPCALMTSRAVRACLSRSLFVPLSLMWGIALKTVALAAVMIIIPY